jgi:hypothetical protein
MQLHPDVTKRESPRPQKKIKWHRKSKIITSSTLKPAE